MARPGVFVTWERFMVDAQGGKTRKLLEKMKNNGMEIYILAPHEIQPNPGIIHTYLDMHGHRDLYKEIISEATELNSRQGNASYISSLEAHIGRSLGRQDIFVTNSLVCFHQLQAKNVQAICTEGQPLKGKKMGTVDSGVIYSHLKAAYTTLRK